MSLCTQLRLRLGWFKVAPPPPPTHPPPPPGRDDSQATSTHILTQGQVGHCFEQMH